MAYVFNPKLPIYLQMMDIIKERIFNGTYNAREAIPSVRELSGEFSLNPNTVQRAFRELEDTGLIITHSTIGRTVTDDDQLIEREREKTCSKIIERMLLEMEKIGIDESEIVSRVEKKIKNK
ncbi:MAG: GntR family transcriptional regulator [Clostridia bacterium]|nr:GntR family transcriptional regulator [Clostridia bacterium]